ncbi:Cytochrome c family protein [hydrothermal vent metagenome]|uniref:Cytochrome c family protein n=1 Tax=hydrothermal vent metagenome TaxID=652676 RepID=A0A3B1A9E8_9ZZZZ
MKLKIIALLIVSGVLVAACDQPLDNKTDASKPADRYDRTTVALYRLEQGKALFQKNCAVCHGNDAQGASDWRKRDKDGKFPPPALDGTAHAWHHPQQALMYTIKNGTMAIGGTMPAWRDKLSDEEIESIILWFQAKWPEQLFQAWVKRDQESRKRAR